MGIELVDVSRLKNRPVEFLERWTKYFEAYTAVDSSKDKPPVPVFMSRNLRANVSNDHAMDGVVVNAGLEFRVQSGSLKRAYVNDTKDVFYRPHKQRKILRESIATARNAVLTVSPEAATA
eukprot:GFYU01000862.1.p1 GENE.GFYU01000862.1~~GFYU01000862.1.p1  ORF type:complete len:121 (-),score=30.63 GFYU01000862.1:418-780(-)